MIVIDSDLLIALLRKEPAAVGFLRDLHDQGEELATTSLNLAEVLRGEAASAARLATALRILAGLVEVPFGPRAARRFGRMMHALDKAGRPMPVLDGMIAAVVLEEGARLATRNARHFGRVAGVEIVSP